MIREKRWKSYKNKNGRKQTRGKKTERPQKKRAAKNNTPKRRDSKTHFRPHSPITNRPKSREAFAEIAKKHALVCWATASAKRNLHAQEDVAHMLTRAYNRVQHLWRTVKLTVINCLIFCTLLYILFLGDSSALFSLALWWVIITHHNLLT